MNIEKFEIETSKRHVEAYVSTDRRTITVAVYEDKRDGFHYANKPIQVSHFDREATGPAQKVQSLVVAKRIYLALTEDATPQAPCPELKAIHAAVELMFPQW